MTKNKELETFYQAVYLKGEKKHFTPFLAKGNTSTEAQEVINEIDWDDKTVLDVGCGTAIPMIKLLKEGFDVEGFDYSKRMVEFGKFELESAKYSSNRVFHADLENNKTMPKRKFDGILALGVFPHIKKEKTALRNIKNFFFITCITYK